MASVNAKLFEWLRLRHQLEDARARLSAAMADATLSDAEVKALHDLVARLQAETESALHEVDQLRAGTARQS